MAWLPAVKAVLPYVTQIVSLAIPAFTKKKAGRTGAGDASIGQISEFQDAVTHNTEAIKALAAQLQQVTDDIDSRTAKIESEIESVTRLAWLAIALATFAVILALFSWVR